MRVVEVDHVVPGADRDTAVVAHSRTTLVSGLEPAETVVLRVGADHWAATVRDIDFEPYDTVYILTLGARIPEDLVDARLADLPPGTDVALHEVVDLLGELRRRDG